MAVFLYLQMIMKKACQYCGKIHDKTHICEKKITFKRPERERYEDSFRSTYLWKQKRESIKKRDRYMCRACYAELPGTIRKLNTENLSVHHISPIHVSPELRLDDDNLITLCAYHHEKAESGEIPADVFRSLTPPYPEESDF